MCKEYLLIVIYLLFRCGIWEPGHRRSCDYRLICNFAVVSRNKDIDCPDQPLRDSDLSVIIDRKKASLGARYECCEQLLSMIAAILERELGA